MRFILGVITGILLILALLVIEQRNRSRYKPSELIKTIQTSATRRQKGEIILPLDEETERREKIIKEKHEQGLDVFLSDL
jgi:hypothetical protein